MKPARDSTIDIDSPLTADLIEALRRDVVRFKEYLGGDVSSAVKDHDCNGLDGRGDRLK